MNQQQKNKKVHTLSLSFTKLGDGIVSPKLVLAWLLVSVGAGANFVGLLVPIREAGALLPQLFTASKLKKVAVRKWWWVAGSAVQGIAVFGMAMVGAFLTGTAAGVAMVVSLTIFALARSICSVSYKDVLGKTVDKQERGLVTGTASSIAGFGVFIFGLLLMFDVFAREMIVFGALFLAGVLWILAAIDFSRLDEAPSEITTSEEESVLKTYKKYIFKDRELQKFLLVRTLLTATAVAPPFILLLAGSVSEQGFLNTLGAMVVASSLATFLSGRVWGRMSDYSTVLVLAVSGLLAGIFLVISLLAIGYNLYATAWFLPLLIFIFMVTYQGVRTARTIHLVNIATEDSRAAYTAISNTIIGMVLMATSLFGFLAEVAGLQVVIVILAAMSFLGGVSAFSLSRD